LTIDSASQFPAFLAVCATVSLALAGCSTTKPKPQISPEPAEVTPTLTQQKMCAEQAKVSYDEYVKSPSPIRVETIGTSYADHFDVKTTTCYVEIFYSFSIDRGATMTNSREVSDAFEGRVYASYMWSSDKVKKYWEVPPQVCSVKPRQEAELTCHSDAEFDKLVLKYFGTSQ
jgi:hypothetical protein